MIVKLDASAELDEGSMERNVGPDPTGDSELSADDSDYSEVDEEEITESNICTCKYEADMTNENKILLRTLDAKILKIYVDFGGNPRASIVKDLVTSLSTAFELDPRDEDSSGYRLRAWAKSIAFDGILNSVEFILTCLKPAYFWDAHDDSIDAHLDALTIFVTIITRMLAIKTTENSFPDYHYDYNVVREDLIGYINDVKNTNFQVGIITGKFSLADLPKFANAGSPTEFLPKDNAREDCAVCKTAEISPDINFALLSNCRHVFCAPCLMKIFETSSKCPVCRVHSVYWLSRDQFLRLQSRHSSQAGQK